MQARPDFTKGLVVSVSFSETETVRVHNILFQFLYKRAWLSHVTMEGGSSQT